MTVKHRVGLVGAGAIAEHHLAALRNVPGVEVVGVVDLDRARADAFAGRLGTRALPDVKALRDEGVDVVHVLTPPEAHAAVAISALELGCHVLVEKPLATSVEDCQRVQAAAERRGLFASVNHSLLFDPQIARALDVVRSGKLGTVVSVDVLRGSAYPPYAGGALPPHYRTAGYPYRDLGVHALYLFEAFLGPVQEIKPMWESRGGDPNLAFDEWRTAVRCRDGLGQFQLSWNVKPMQSQVIIQGTRGVLRVDLFLMFHARRSSTPLPKAAERVINALTDSAQPLVDVPIGVLKFATKRIKPFQGLHDLVAAFYRALDGGGPPPVSLAEATNAVRWVEEVARAADAEHAARVSRLPCADTADVLVTGASGGVGEAVLRRLADGRKVRILVRRPPRDLPPGVDVVIGNLGDPDAVERAVRGAKAVVHVGATMKGGWEEHLGGTVVGTQNVVEASRRHGVRKLVHISSMSVVDWAGNDRGEVTERTGYEPRAEDRGPYTRAKLEAERIVLAAVAEHGLPAVVLRPGQIFGGKLPLLTPAVARRAGRRWIVLGDGEQKLPLVHLEDVVDAIVTALDGPLRGGEVVQLVDPLVMTQNAVLSAVVPGASVVHLPRTLLLAAGKLSEPVFGLLKRKSPVSAYRLRSALARHEYRSEKAEPLLGWTPRVGVAEGLRRAAAALAGAPVERPAPSLAEGLRAAAAGDAEAPTRVIAPVPELPPAAADARPPRPAVRPE